jgi:hypothetical protein
VAAPSIGIFAEAGLWPSRVIATGSPVSIIEGVPA